MGFDNPNSLVCINSVLELNNNFKLTMMISKYSE